MRFESFSHYFSQAFTALVLLLSILTQLRNGYMLLVERLTATATRSATSYNYRQENVFILKNEQCIRRELYSRLTGFFIETLWERITVLKEMKMLT